MNKETCIVEYKLSNHIQYNISTLKNVVIFIYIGPSIQDIKKYSDSNILNPRKRIYITSITFIFKQFFNLKMYLINMLFNACQVAVENSIFPDIRIKTP